MDMTGEFIVMIDRKLVTYTNFDDIPEQIEHVIKFLPDVPVEDPETGHTVEEHEFMDTFTPKLQELMEREELWQQSVE